jgi:hypothetical protein
MKYLIRRVLQARVGARMPPRVRALLFQAGPAPSVDVAGGTSWAYDGPGRLSLARRTAWTARPALTASSPYIAEVTADGGTSDLKPLSQAPDFTRGSITKVSRLKNPGLRPGGAAEQGSAPPANQAPRGESLATPTRPLQEP